MPSSILMDWLQKGLVMAKKKKEPKDFKTETEHAINKLVKANTFKKMLANDCFDSTMFATHVSKFLHTKISLNNVANLFDDSVADNRDYLCTANSGYSDPDIIFNGATVKAMLATFLSCEITYKDAQGVEKIVTILQLLKDDYKYLRDAITYLIDENYLFVVDDYDDFRNKALSCVKTPMPINSSPLNNQIYFPVAENDYVLLDPIPSTVLFKEVHNKLKNVKNVSKIRYAMGSDKWRNTTTSKIVTKTGDFVTRDMSANYMFLTLPPQSLLKKNKRKVIYPKFNVENMQGVQNGMLIDDTLLDTICKEGLRGRATAKAERAERDDSVKRNFLEKYGWSVIPNGYEIHHIIPISQGGADAVENMILLTKAQHATITRCHSAYFGWHMRV